MIDTTQTEEDILNRIKTVLPRVWVSEVPANTDPGDPYIIVYFGEPIRTATGRHLEGPRRDVMISYFTVQIVSKTDDAARKIKNKVKNALYGWKPYDSDYIVSEGGVSRSRAAVNGATQMYYREMGFSYRTNMISE